MVKMINELLIVQVFKGIRDKINHVYRNNVLNHKK